MSLFKLPFNFAKATIEPEKVNVPTTRQLNTVENVITSPPIAGPNSIRPMKAEQAPPIPLNRDTI